jgi:hypothetical protein
VTDDLVERLRGYATPDDVADELMEQAADRIEALEAALHEMLEIVATHRVYVGNSPAGELACEWTMDSIKEIHAKMEDVLARIKRTVWLNVYENTVVGYPTRYDADDVASTDRLACVKVEIDCEKEEGL